MMHYCNFASPARYTGAPRHWLAWTCYECTTSRHSASTDATARPAGPLAAALPAAAATDDPAFAAAVSAPARGISWGRRMKSIGLLILRVTAGTILAAHGYTKLFGGPGKTPPALLTRLFGPNFLAAVEQSGPDRFGHTLERVEVPSPHVSAYMSGAAEFGGGLAFLLGLRTRGAALMVLFNMGAAIRKVHWKNGLYGEGGFEFPLLLAAVAATLLVAGPGTLSLDAIASVGND